MAPAENGEEAAATQGGRPPTVVVVAIIVAIVIGAGIFLLLQTPWWQNRGLSDCGRALTGVDASDVIANCPSADEIAAVFDANPDRDFGFFDGQLVYGSRSPLVSTDKAPIAVAAFCKAHGQGTPGSASGLCATAPAVSECEALFLRTDGADPGLDDIARTCRTFSGLYGSDLPTDTAFWSDADGTTIYVNGLNPGPELLAKMRAACRDLAGLPTDAISIYDNSSSDRERFGSVGAGICADVAQEDLTQDEIDEGYNAKVAEVRRAESLADGLFSP